MNDLELQKLATLLQLPPDALSLEKPLDIVLNDGQYHFTLQKNAEAHVLLTLFWTLPAWCPDLLQTIVEDCSCCKEKACDYSVGYLEPQVLFLCDEGDEPTAIHIEKDLLSFIDLQQRYTSLI